MTGHRQIEPVSLEAARQAGIALLIAEDEYIVAIQAAHESGNSSRSIARQLGVSFQWVSKIVNDTTTGRRRLLH